MNIVPYKAVYVVKCICFVFILIVDEKAETLLILAFVVVTEYATETENARMKE